jgi:hypothetical protein
MPKFKFTNEPDYADLRYLWDKGQWPNGVPSWAQEVADFLDIYPAHPVVTQKALERIVERQIEELAQVRGQLKDVLADRHNFRAGLRHVQTELVSVASALSSITDIVATTLDDERGLPRGFEHEPGGEGIKDILTGEKP